MKLLRNILIGLGAAGFVLAIGAVLLFNQPRLGWQLLSVPTGSMRPTMSPGSLVLTHRVPISSLKVGDIITHTNPLTMRSTLTHRIVREYKIDGKIPAFVTKGDANPSPDPPVVAGLVQGRMVAHVPDAGELLMWAKTWFGIAVLVYLPALIIMIQETRRMAAYLRQTKPYHLEGWRPPQQREHTLQLKPSMAVTAAVALAVAGIGWQTAAALSPEHQSAVLFVLSPNVITAKFEPKHPLPDGSTNSGTTSTTYTPKTKADDNTVSGDQSSAGNATMTTNVAPGPSHTAQSGRTWHDR